jgi:hypothetical protein
MVRSRSRWGRRYDLPGERDLTGRGVELRLLERERELATIGELLDGVVLGRGRVLAVQGDAGIGKTALLDRCAADAPPRGVRVLRALGDVVAMDSPFACVRELLLPEVERLPDLVSDGAAALAAPVFEAGSAQLDSSGVLHGLYWLVSDIAERQPLALLLDDAQWLDPASRRFV